MNAASRHPDPHFVIKCPELGLGIPKTRGQASQKPDPSGRQESLFLRSPPRRCELAGIGSPREGAGRAAATVGWQRGRALHSRFGQLPQNSGASRRAASRGRRATPVCGVSVRQRPERSEPARNHCSTNDTALRLTDSSGTVRWYRDTLRTSGPDRNGRAERNDNFQLKILWRRTPDCLTRANEHVE